MTKFLPYGVDKQVKCTVTDREEDRPIHKGSIANGTLTLTRWHVYERTYSFDHSGSSNIPHLFIEHRFRKGDEHSLWDTQEIASKTENFYRFCIRANAGEVTVFTVKERKETTLTYTVTSASEDTARSWRGSRYITEAALTHITTDWIPWRERVNKQQSATYEAQRNLDSSVNQANSNYNNISNQAGGSSYYYSSVDQPWNAGEVSERTMTWATDMLSSEPLIRRWRETVRVETDKLTKDQAVWSAKVARFTDESIVG